jgi:hypothetical protein
MQGTLNEHARKSETFNYPTLLVPCVHSFKFEKVIFDLQIPLHIIYNNASIVHLSNHIPNSQFGPCVIQGYHREYTYNFL